MSDKKRGVPETCKHNAHGLRAMQGALKRIENDGADWLASLGSVGRAVRELRDEFIDHVGGPEQVSVVERIIVEEAAKEWLMIQSLDQFILSTPIVNKRRREVFPILQQRQKLVDSMIRKLEKLGIKKRPKPISLHDWEPPSDAA